jgi:LysM repeat protein
MRRFLVILATLATILGLGAHAVSAGQKHPTPVHRYMVRPGDTLWGIAGAAGLAGDRRETVYRVMELNHLGSASLQPGQRILLPSR